jgi:hypothetical protein
MKTSHVLAITRRCNARTGFGLLEHQGLVAGFSDLSIWIADTALIALLWSGGSVYTDDSGYP